MTANYRGKHNHYWRRVGESALDMLQLNGWFARQSFQCGLHGKLSITRYSVTLPAAKRLHAPLKIALLTDFHAGPSTHPAIFAQAFAAVAEASPDVLLLGGDFVSCKARYVDALTEHLSACQPPLGKFAVFGNHDLWTDDAYLTQQLTAAGVTVLVNGNRRLPAPFDTVSICGMDDPWTGEADAKRTFADAQAVRLLLMHAADGLLLLGDETFDAAFAGHTHGGQIALRDGTPIVLPHGPLSRQYHHGFFAIAHNGALIVSRGVGCSNVPIRINADAELVICTVA